jgi:WD40 repeat protein
MPPTSYGFTHLYQDPHPSSINSIAITPDSLHLFSAGGDLEIVELKQWDLSLQTLIRDFGTSEMTGLITPRKISSQLQPEKLNPYEILDIAISVCGEFLFTADG